MKVNVLLFVLLSFCGYTQDFVRGRVFADYADVEGILVVNLHKQTEILTDSLGNFSIRANIDDLLVFSSSKFYKKRHLIEETDFQNLLVVKLESISEVIETVEVNRISIKPEELGIVNYTPKRPTVAQRRLHTAKSESHLGALINLISGRTKMLKTLEKMDREDRRVSIISRQFSDSYFENQLGISPDNITEFKYFALHSILEKIKEKHKQDYFNKLTRNELELLLIPLAEQYLKYN